MEGGRSRRAARAAWSSFPARDAGGSRSIVVGDRAARSTSGTTIDRHAPDAADDRGDRTRSFTTKEHPDYLAALAKRGITDSRRRPDRPVAGGRVRVRVRGRPPDLAVHLVPARPTPTDNGYARPIEGLIVHFDMGATR